MTSCCDRSYEDEKLDEGALTVLGGYSHGHEGVRGDRTRALETMSACRDVIPSAIILWGKEE